MSIKYFLHDYIRKCIFFTALNPIYDDYIERKIFYFWPSHYLSLLFSLTIHLCAARKCINTIRSPKMYFSTFDISTQSLRCRCSLVHFLTSSLYIRFTNTPHTFLYDCAYINLCRFNIRRMTIVISFRKMAGDLEECH